MRTKRRAQRLMSVHTGAQRRIIKIADKIHDMDPERWFKLYAPAFDREVRRKETARQRLATYLDQREDWRRNGGQLS